MSDDSREKLPMKELLSLPAGKYLATALGVAVVLAAVILACRLDDILGAGVELKFRHTDPAVVAKA